MPCLFSLLTLKTGSQTLLDFYDLDIFKITVLLLCIMTLSLLG